MGDKSLECLKQIESNTRPKTSFQLIVSSNKTEFTTTYDTPILLDRGGGGTPLGGSGNFEMALVNLETYYSFPNINPLFRYSADNGRTWQNILIPERSYELQDINDAVSLQMKQNNHFDKIHNKSFVTLAPNASTLRTIMEITHASYQVDFNTEKSIRSVLGFNAKTYRLGYYESENIVNILTLNSIFVEIDIIRRSYVNGRRNPVVYSFFPNVSPGFKIVQEPLNLVYLPVCGDKISSLTVRLTDQNGKLLNLRGEVITIRFHVREM